MTRLRALVRREFWEHRALWVTPLAIAVLLALGVAVFGHVQLDVSWQHAGPAPGGMLALATLSTAVPFYLAALILVPLYLLDCLYAERRDRSILFWKSMPVSDATTVLVKFAVGMLIVPLLAFAAAAVTSLIVAGLFALRHHGYAAGDLPVWNTLIWLRTQGLLLYGLLGALCWYAPYAAYLLLVSAWARRSVYAWALIPPILLALLERMLLGTEFVSHILQRSLGEFMRLAFRLRHGVDDGLGGTAFGGAGRSFGDSGERMLMQPLDPSGLLWNLQFWLGLAVAALLIGGAIRLRRYRDES